MHPTRYIHLVSRLGKKGLDVIDEFERRRVYAKHSSHCKFYKICRLASENQPLKPPNDESDTLKTVNSLLYYTPVLICTNMDTLQAQSLEEVHEDLLAGNQLLRHERGDGNHGQPSVIQFLALHVLPLLGVGGEQTQGVEAQVAGLVVVPQRVEVRGTGSCHPKPTLYASHRAMMKMSGSQNTAPRASTCWKCR